MISVVDECGDAIVSRSNRGTGHMFSTILSLWVGSRSKAVNQDLQESATFLKAYISYLFHHILSQTGIKAFRGIKAAIFCQRQNFRNINKSIENGKRKWATKGHKWGQNEVGTLIWQFIVKFADMSQSFWFPRRSVKTD